MQLNWLDWSMIIAYLIVSLSIGLIFSRRAGKSLSEYFISGHWTSAIAAIAGAACCVLLVLFCVSRMSFDHENNHS